MKVGIPRALGYHRYGVLWETFFQELNIGYVVSDNTSSKHLIDGAKNSVDESCLPLKIYMGHVASLAERCDLIFVPHFRRLGKEDEFCVRFWGLYDMVQNTFSDSKLLSYQLSSGKPGHQMSGFVQMGRVLGKSPARSSKAYLSALKHQQSYDNYRLLQGQEALSKSAPKILLATQPYIAADSFLGGTLARLIRSQGGIPLFPDAWNRKLCRGRSHEISTDLYWITNREILGAIQEARLQVDGIILLTAFPCGSDCLTNELILRRVRDLPIIQILLDDGQGMAGLETRIESFMDMIEQRRSQLGNAVM